MMTTNTFSIWPLMWQSFNVGLLIAIIVLGLRLAWLLWPRKQAAAPQAAPDEPSSAALADVLRAYRTRCRMTQEFVAESLGVSRQAVSKWESGTSEPSTANLLALARLFGVDAAEMLKSVK